MISDNTWNPVWLPIEVGGVRVAGCGMRVACCGLPEAGGWYWADGARLAVSGSGRTEERRGHRVWRKGERREHRAWRKGERKEHGAWRLALN